MSVDPAVAILQLQALLAAVWKPVENAVSLRQSAVGEGAFAKVPVSRGEVVEHHGSKNIPIWTHWGGQEEQNYFILITCLQGDTAQCQGTPSQPMIFPPMCE